MRRIEVLLKISLAVLLLLCVPNIMPYGYYQLIRAIAFVGFGYLTYTDVKRGAAGYGLTFLVATVAFNPFLQFSFGRLIWSIVDVVLSIVLIYAVLKSESIKS